MPTYLFAYSLIFLADSFSMIIKVMPFYVCFRAREALRQCLPDPLKDNTFAATLQDDNSTKRWLVQLQQNLESPGVPDPRSMPLLQQ